MIFSFFRKKTQAAAVPAHQTEGWVTPEIASPELSSFAPLPHWPSALDKVLSLLRPLGEMTEGEFLRVGNALASLQCRAEQVSRLAAEAAELLSGDEVASAVAELAELLDALTATFHNWEVQKERTVGTIDNWRKLLTAMEEPVAAFGKLNKVLRTVGTATKIESTRIADGADFNALADDVKLLSIKVNERAREILKEKETLAPVLVEAAKRLQLLDDNQRGKVADVLEKLKSSLVTLQELNCRNMAAADNVAQLSSGFGSEIIGIVVSLQFHDISRQQVEHVVEAVEEVGGALRSGRTDTVQLLAEVAAVSRLQASQLDHARTEFLSAISEIVDRLGRLAAGEQALAAHATSMEGGNGGSDESILDALDADLDSVIPALADAATAGTRVQDSLGAVSKTVSRMTSFIADIEGMGEEIDLLALNAQVKAARTDSRGAGLGVLAEAIQHLSVDALREAGAVGEMLTRIDDLAREMMGTDDTSRQNDGIETAPQRVRELAAVLRKVHEAFRKQVVELSAEAALAVSEIGDLMGQFAFGSEVERVLAGGSTELQRVADEAAAILPAGYQAQVNLEHLAERYTMHSERRVHSGCDLPTAAAAVSDGSGSDGLGDNVELF